MMTATKRLSIKKLQRKMKDTKKGYVKLDPHDFSGSIISPVVSFTLKDTIDYFAHDVHIIVPSPRLTPFTTINDT